MSLYPCGLTELQAYIKASSRVLERTQMTFSVLGVQCQWYTGRTFFDIANI
jgi:hypothetical protein